MPFESTLLYDKDGRIIAPITIVDNIANDVHNPDEPADIAPLKTSFDNRDEANPTSFEDVEEMVSGDTNSSHFSKLSATVKNTRYLNKELEKKISLHKGEEAPTDESELWIDTSAGETFNLPEIDDNNVSHVDTWSSAKIKEMIEDAGVIVTQEEYDSLSEEEKASGTFFISDAEEIENATVLDYDNTNSGIEATNVQDAIDTALSRPVNNNLLINSNFANPVNQRGITAESWEKGSYGFDRWIQTGCIISSINANGLTLRYDGESSSGNLYQLIEKGNIVSGETYSFSICIDDKVIYGTAIAPNEVSSDIYEDERLRIFLYYSTGKDCHGLYIRFKDTAEHTIKWVKLEEGSVATPYVPRLYAEELALCQRYYDKYSIGAPVRLVDTNRIKFFGNLRGNMRVTQPTVTLGVANVTVDDKVQSGFTVSVSASSMNGILVEATKTSHGISTTSAIYLDCDVILDAEV